MNSFFQILGIFAVLMALAFAAVFGKNREKEGN
jgi:hypothetical protein